MGISRHLTPYARPSPLNLRDQARLRALKVELEQYNKLKCPVTFDDITDSWENWQRPVRVLLHGGMTSVAASGFESLPDGYERPQCPHTNLPVRDRQMVLHLKKPFLINTRIDFFRATSHACAFTVVPPLREPVYTQSPHMIAEQLGFSLSFNISQLTRAQKKPPKLWSSFHLHALLTSQPDDMDHLSAPFLSPSEAEVVQLLTLQQLPTPTSSPSASTSSRATSTSAPTSPFPPDADITLNRRVIPALYAMTKPSRPSPTPRRSSSQQGHCFYDKSVAEARATSALIWDGYAELHVMGHVYLNYNLGVYEEYPEKHPAANSNDTHRILQPYDERIYPGCLDSTFQHLTYVSTNIGHAIRELNSNVGIPRTALNVLVSDATTCDACNCIFSLDGYNAHVTGRQCGNSISPVQVKTKDVDLDDLQPIPLRQFVEAPGHVAEFMDRPVGAAYVEWNSRLGVPQDVWALISTAYVECKVCHLCRTFDGDRAHRDLTGVCMDGGNGVASLAGKGKQAAEDPAAAAGDD
ncbi:hypothetical protein FPV67DRAFT_1445383 [Lyophyllum atratum]|nr:hypothetical protein FPV67DRAFT_1445383 [Lyophyllum atratum]